MGIDGSLTSVKVQFCPSIFVDLQLDNDNDPFVDSVLCKQFPRLPNLLPNIVCGSKNEFSINMLLWFLSAKSDFFLSSQSIDEGFP